MLEEVMKLLNAGFTADEIRQLALSPKDQKPEGDPTPKDDPKPAEDPTPKDDPKPAADPAPKDPKQDSAEDPVLAAIERLTGSFNAFVSRSTGLDKLPSDDPERAAEKILQEVLKGVKPKE